MASKSKGTHLDEEEVLQRQVRLGIEAVQRAKGREDGPPQLALGPVTQRHDAEEVDVLRWVRTVPAKLPAVHADVLLDLRDDVPAPVCGQITAAVYFEQLVARAARPVRDSVADVRHQGCPAARHRRGVGPNLVVCLVRCC